MTDKSFGDHTNRNIVKNPLLSTAVTGLSIEDLTHNAVLLPVSLSQEAVTRPEQQSGPQNRALENTSHVHSNFPSGDAKTNPYPYNLPPKHPPTSSTAPRPLKTGTTPEKPCANVSKASAKSDDDFDVNEYFARLHGTRYVSAPLSSVLPEDANAILEATEENLEEINLNEPDKQIEEVQQSLTADIAQNFSQLPTVLPQMASAVFSSFSNMLQTRKSREPTPDFVRSGGYQEVQFERPESIPREFAPPPKEPLAMPPTVGTGNYRLPPKKKYAQIPGLTSGDHAQNPFQSVTQNAPPIAQHMPQYFIPNPAEETPAQLFPTQPSAHEAKTNENAKTETQKTYFVPNFENPEPKTEIKDAQLNTQNIPRDKTANAHSEVKMFSQNEQSNFDVNLQAVLPPPPMFCNAPRRDSQGSIGKTILPPSVARRISANQPIIKGAPQISAFTDSIFTPQMVSESDSMPNVVQSDSSAPNQSAFAPFNPQLTPKPSNLDAGIPLLPTASVPLSAPPRDTLPLSIFPPSKPETSNLSGPSAFIPPASTPQTQLPPFGSIAPPQQPPSVQTYTQPSIFTPMPVSQTLPSAPSVFLPDPSQAQINPSFGSIAPPPLFPPAGAATPSIPSASQPLSTPSMYPLEPSPAQSNTPFGSTAPPPLFPPRAASTAQPCIFTSNIPPASQPLSTPSMYPPEPSPAQSNTPFGSTAPPPLFPPRAASTAQPSIFTPNMPPASQPLSTPSIYPPESSSAQSNTPLGFVAPPLFPPRAASTSHSSIFTSSKPSANQPLSAPSMYPPEPSSIQSNPPFGSIVPPPLFPPTAGSIPSQPTIFTPCIPTNVSQIPSTPSFPPASSSVQASVPFGPIAPPPHIPSTAGQVPTILTPSTVTQTLPGSLTSSANTTTPPFFNPSAINPAEISEFPPIASQPTDTPDLPVQEPPKASSNVSFRMTKKRPQYYSGPIEGIGAISNNVKPVIAPVDSSSFQGALFTPQDSVSQVAAPEQVPFDISRPVEPPTYGIQAQPQQIPEYNTALDMSRPTSESFEEPKQESGGFGLLGSLKSKLSSLDINKIQSSVTTFFDPAYNHPKREDSSIQENVPYRFTPSYGQGSNFEVFVPNIEQVPSNQSYQNQYNYNQGRTTSYYHQDSYNYQHQQDAANFFPNSQTYQATDSRNSEAGSAFANQQENIETQVFTNINLTNPATASNAQEIQTQILYNTAQVDSKITEPQMFNTPFYSTPTQQDNQVAESHTATQKTTFPQMNNDTNVNNIQNAAQTNNFFETHTNVSESLQIDTHSELKVAEINYPLPQDFSLNGTDLLMRSVEGPSEDMLSNTQTNGNLPTNGDTNLPAMSPVSFTQTPTTFFESPVTQNLAANETISQDLTANSHQNLEDKNLHLNAAASFFDSTIQSQNIQEISAPETEEQAVESRLVNDCVPNIAMSLKDNPADFFGSFSQGDATPESFFSKYTFDPDSKTTTNALEEQSKNTERYNASVEVDGSRLDVASAPLFGLSAILADQTRATYLENEMTHMTMHEPKDPQRNPAIAFLDNAVNTESVIEKDFDICETCREVNKPEDYIERDREDLTQQLIENITSPIQLSNPVEVPLTESNIVDANFDTNETADFDISQCAEISHITEETIEAIQVQSAVELLDDEDEITLENNVRNYGWVTEEPIPLIGEPVERNDYPLSTLQAQSLEPGYTMPVDLNAIGFYGNNALFQNLASNDEIKAEFDVDDTPIVMPRQMSLPTAPPEEEDTKSEGIDVHSIELDAKKEFPIFEEFVIEPADDDEDDVSTDAQSTANTQDSFTSRVDKFQKKDDNETEKKTSPIFGSPSVPMASYFDTGNYAVETHYRNSLTSPTTVTFGSPSQVTVPPGFEEFSTRFVIKDSKSKNDIPFIPETSTQTKSTYSPTFSMAQTLNSSTTSSVTTKISESVDMVAGNMSLPDFSSDFGAKNIETEAFSAIGATVITSLNLTKTDLPERIIEQRKLTDFAGAFDAQPQIKPEIPVFEKPNPDFSVQHNAPLTEPMSFFDLQSASIEHKTQTDFAGVLDMKAETPIFEKPKTNLPVQENVPLPEPMNFFASTSQGTMELKQSPEFSGAQDIKPQQIKPETPLFTNPKSDIPLQQDAHLSDPMNFFVSSSQTEKTDSQDTGFKRLASYFSSPAKTDNTKSFFELRQSQDHYRQGVSNTNDPNVANPTPLGTQNIDQAKYFELMNDLTSVHNAEFKPEQIVRTVNYFTVEYDNKNLVNELKNSEPDFKTDHIDELDDKSAFDHVKKCKHCNLGFLKAFRNIHHDVLTAFKVKSCMNTNTEPGKKISMDIDLNSEEARRSVSVNFDATESRSNTGVDLLTENRSSSEYTPVKHHWFYRVDIEGKSTWRGFSVVDSRALEDAYNSPGLNENTVVATDGGRYDVNIIGRLRFAVYWSDNPSNVRRCSWFYKGTTDARYVPYTEAVAEKLEEEYRHGVTTGEWHRRLVLPNNEMVVMHGPAVIVHFLQAAASDAFSSPAIFSTAFGKRVYRNPPKIRVSRDQPSKIDHLVMLVHGAGEYRHQQDKIQSTTRPRVVRRGYDESEIEEMEPTSIDHLLLLCHGVGSACDMRFRNVEEVVDDFRATSLQLIQSHYKNSYESGDIGRVEVLPISWHATLHSGETGVDRRLACITLDSIPKLRNFTNDTVLDVLFYTSPVFCQTIINTVCAELNRIYKLFKQRNPEFKGGVSLGGHSLGSVILYDLLSHQVPAKSQDIQDKRYVSGAEGCGQPAVSYPKLDFPPVALYALGSPIAIFECIRGVDSLGKDFALPTCSNFFNIFHPYDPIAYRIEPLINPDLRTVKPQLIPHHKGRKRMHLELKDTMARVGADIKQKLIESIKSTWYSMWKTQEEPPIDRLEKVVEEEMEKEGLTAEEEPPSRDETTPEMLGRLNAGRRVDYVLQEAPFEMINEYLFAMSSHVCYWESEDTMLLMLREIYDSLGVQPDSTVPQQSLTVHRTRVPSKTDEPVAVNSGDPSTSRGSL